jgi:teichoic acid transport system permease protein
MTGKPADASGRAAVGIADAGMDADGEPAVLGAAATLPDQRRRNQRRQRRAERRHVGRSSRPPAPDPEGYSDVEYVFEAGGVNTTPLRPYIRSLWERRRFMLAMARGEIRGQRSSAALGAVWSVLDPLFQGAIYFLLFTIIRRGGRPIDFLHVLIGGIFLFQLAIGALNQGGRSLKSSKNLLLNSTFPRAVFPLATVCKGVLTLPPAIAIYAVFHAALGAPFGWGLLLLPALFAFQVMLMVGLSLLVSTLVVFFKDADNAVNYITRLLFFTTPVIYPYELLPESLRPVLSFQPFFALFSSYQTILDGNVPGLWQMTQVVIWAVIALVVGLRVFRRHEHEFAMRL